MTDLTPGFNGTEASPGTQSSRTATGAPAAINAPRPHVGAPFEVPSSSLPTVAPIATPSPASPTVAPLGAPFRAPAAAQPTPHALDLQWTSLRRGRQAVLAPGRLMLPLGAAVGLVGVNGAGKSTLFMALAGVLAVRCGQASASSRGLDVATVGYVPQRPTLAPWLSVRGALALQGVAASTGLAGSPATSFLAPLLDRRADSLSGGQLQLAAVSGTLARNDQLVLLDEPFAGIDIRHRGALVASVSDHRRRSPGSVIILASHLAGDLHAICDWFVVLLDGSVVFAGPRNALPPTAEEAQWESTAPGHARADLTDPAVLERRLAALLGGNGHTPTPPS